MGCDKMDLTINRLVSLVVIFVITGFGSTLRIDIEPQHINDVTDELNVTCVGDGPSYWAQTIMVIQIIKQNQDGPIVSINNVQRVTEGIGFTKNMKAEGIIVEKDASKSFLTLTIANPTVLDAGLYQCQTFFLDEKFQMNTKNAISNVTFEEQDVSDVVNDLVDKVLHLIQTVEKQAEIDAKHKDEIEKLQKEYINFNMEYSKYENFSEILKNMTGKLNQHLQNDIAKEYSNFETLEKQLDVLRDKANKQKDLTVRLKQINDDNTKLNDIVKTQQQELDNFTDTIGKLKDSMLRLDNKLKDNNVEQNTIETQEKHIETLTDMIKKQNNKIETQDKKMETLTNMIKQQNDHFQTMQAQLKGHERLIGILACPDGWTYYEGDHTCIKVFGIEKSKRLFWSRAREACQGYHGGDLVMIKDNGKKSLVSELLSIVERSYYVWIGIRNHATEGFDFKYVDGSSLGSFQPWSSNDPNGNPNGSVDQCVFIHPPTGQWIDNGCNYNDTYVCSTPSRIAGVF